jgi:hypothetical protein
MTPIAQQQYSEFKSALNAYGLMGDFEDYSSLEEAMENGGLQFSHEWKELYDTYNATMTEINAVSIICVVTAMLSFSYAVIKMQRKQ